MAPPDAPTRSVWTRAVLSVRGQVHRLPGGVTVWRVGVAVVGLVVVVVGIVLLPLPGPGWLIIFLGIGVWATEFAWAHRLLKRTNALVGRWRSWVVSQPRWRQGLSGAIGFAVVVGAVVLCLWLSLLR